MKRPVKLLILVLVLAVAVGAYFVVQAVNKKNSQTVDDNISLLKYTPADGDTIEYGYNGEDITLVYRDKAWHYADDDSFPLSTYYAITMAAAVDGLTATTKLDTTEALSEYGLDAPQLTIYATAGGQKNTIAVGNKNNTADGYYVQVNGGSDVYLVTADLVQAFSYGLMDLVQKETIPSVTNATEIKASVNGTDYDITRTDVVSTPDPAATGDGSGTSDSTTTYTWSCTANGGAAQTLDGDKTVSFLDGFSSLAWQKCVYYNATAEQKTACGLADPAASFQVTYPDGAFTLNIGAQEGDSYYACLGDSGIVYLISADAAQTYLGFDPASLQAAS